MRVALVHNLPSGGALRVVAAQALALTQRHDVEVFTLSTAETGLMGTPLSGLSHHVLPFTPGRSLGRPLGMLNPLIRLADLARLSAVYTRMARRIDEGRFDVALVHPCSFTQAPMVLAHLKTPSAYVCHEPPRTLYEPELILEHGPGSRPRRWRDVRNLPLDWALRNRMLAIDRQGVACAGLVLVQSSFCAESVIRAYRRWPRVLRWGVDRAIFRPATDPGAAHAGTRQEGERACANAEGPLLSVGAMAWVKGFWFLVEAVAALPEPHRRPLVIVSDRIEPGHRRWLEERARGLSVRLLVHERIADEALVGLYREAAVTVYAPVLEPFGLVPLESMACGTPVVGVREGGVRETIVDGVTGLLAEREPEAFARRIEALLTDPGLRSRLSAAGLADVGRSWTWERSIDQLLVHLDRLARREVSEPRGAHTGDRT